MPLGDRRGASSRNDRVVELGRDLGLGERLGDASLNLSGHSVCAATSTKRHHLHTL